MTIHPVERRRWWILSLFCTLSGLNSFLWVSLSTVATKVRDFYGCSNLELFLLPTICDMVCRFSVYRIFRYSGLMTGFVGGGSELDVHSVQYPRDLSSETIRHSILRHCQRHIQWNFRGIAAVGAVAGVVSMASRRKCTQWNRSRLLLQPSIARCAAVVPFAREVAGDEHPRAVQPVRVREWIEFGLM